LFTASTVLPSWSVTLSPTRRITCDGVERTVTPLRMVRSSPAAAVSDAVRMIAPSVMMFS